MEVKERIKEIKRSFRQMMDGAVAQSMRDKGVNYKLNWGATLPRLREMADELREDNMPIGTIPVDAIYTPIRKVNWSVENWRVEQKTDYEKLELEVVTDGSISPSAALQEAASILIYHFKLFTDDQKLSQMEDEQVETKELDEESLHMRHVLLTKLSDVGLSVRAYNCLKAADIDTFADLVSYSRPELMKFRNFGRKSLNEIDLLVDKMGLSFGMDVTKYNIEPKKKNNV